MRIAASLSLLLLGGCTLFGPAEQFRISKRACDAKFTKWHGGLTYHILQGSGDGSFNYSPDTKVHKRIRGEYDLATGDFEWEEEWSNPHWRVLTQVEGYGFAKVNGNLDVLYTRTDEDILGEITVQEIREERIKCKVTRRTRWDGTWGASERWHEGKYLDGRYTYEEDYLSGDDAWHDEGKLRDDLTWIEDSTGTGVDFSYVSSAEGDQATGYSRTDFTQESKYDYAGFYERWMDGREHWRYTIDEDAEFDYEHDYYGNGSGTYIEPGLSCSVTFEDWDCSMSCDDGRNYSC